MLTAAPRTEDAVDGRPRAAAASRTTSRTRPSTGSRSSAWSTTPSSRVNGRRTRQAGRGLARRALAYELRQRGIDHDLVGATLEDPELADELETARLLVRRRLGAMGGGDDGDRDRRTRRLLGMLARKGYGSGVAARAVREVLAERTAERRRRRRRDRSVRRVRR